MSVDTSREQTGLGAVVETEQLTEPLTEALEDYLQARAALEDTIIRAVLEIDSDTPPVNLKDVRLQVIEAYKALSNQGYYPNLIIARPSQRLINEEPGQQG